MDYAHRWKISLLPFSRAGKYRFLLINDTVGGFNLDRFWYNMLPACPTLVQY